MVSRKWRYSRKDKYGNSALWTRLRGHDGSRSALQRCKHSFVLSSIRYLLIIIRLKIGPGTIQAGIYSYSALPLAGATVFENTTDVSSYSYDASKKELVSYDTPDIATLKAQYVVSKGMAGQMFWDVRAT